ncbi:hypothetical protein DSUL_60197 [Desulfovibrionales bacterium]
MSVNCVYLAVFFICFSTSYATFILEGLVNHKLVVNNFFQISRLSDCFMRLIGNPQVAIIVITAQKKIPTKQWSRSCFFKVGFLFITGIGNGYKTASLKKVLAIVTNFLVYLSNVI